MGGEWRHDVMAKGNRARLCRTELGRELLRRGAATLSIR